MTDVIEMLRDALTVQKLASEVKLSEETREKIDRVCQIYIEKLLPSR